MCTDLSYRARVLNVLILYSEFVYFTETLQKYLEVQNNISQLFIDIEEWNLPRVEQENVDFAMDRMKKMKEYIRQSAGNDMNCIQNKGLIAKINQFRDDVVNIATKYKTIINLVH